MLRRQYEVRSMTNEGGDIRMALQSIESADERDSATLLIRAIDAIQFRIGDLIYLEIIPAMLADDDTDPDDHDPATRPFR